MPINAAALKRELQVFAQENLSPEAQRQFFAESAAEIEAETVAEWRRLFGRDPAYERVVDGTPGAPISEAKKVVILRLTPVAAAAQYAWNLLKQHAKVRRDPPGEINGFPPGRYRGAFEIELNGKVVTSINLDVSSPNDVYILTNTLPYARILESSGDNIGAPLPVSRGGLLESVAASTKAEFGNSVAVIFNWLEFPGAGPKGPASRRKAKSQRATDDRFPAIIIRALR